MAEPAYTFDVSLGRYRDDAGHFVAQTVLDTAAAGLQAQTRDEVAVLTQRLTAGTLTPARWEAAMATTLREAHLTATALAGGGWARMPDYQDALVDRLTGEFTALAGFRQALPDLSDAQIAVRADMYAQGVWSTYQRTLGLLADDTGMDEERNVTDPAAESCAECDGLEADGWVDLDTLPEVGDRTCMSNCRCTIEYRRAGAAPAGEEERALVGVAVVKYAEDQPREPAGSSTGGEWTTGGSGGEPGATPAAPADLPQRVEDWLAGKYPVITASDWDRASGQSGYSGFVAASGATYGLRGDSHWDVLEQMYRALKQPWNGNYDAGLRQGQLVRFGAGGTYVALHFAPPVTQAQWRSVLPMLGERKVSWEVAATTEHPKQHGEDLRPLQRALAQAQGTVFDATRSVVNRVVKYSPDQPRIPAGQPGGGQWGGSEGDSGAVVDAAALLRDVPVSVAGEEALQRRVAEALGARIEGLPGYDPERFATWLAPPADFALRAMRGWQAAADDPQADKLQSAAATQFQLPAASRDQLFQGAEHLSATDAYRYGLLTTAIYAQTQAHLHDAGAGAVTLYRGESWHPDQFPPGETAPHFDHRAMLAPLSSWTTTASDASVYALRRGESGRRPVVLSATVPAARVFSLPTTGIGGALDREIVVLGGSLPVRIHAVTPGQAVTIDHKAYNPDQPRVPAGQPGGGEWGTGEGSTLLPLAPATGDADGNLPPAAYQYIAATGFDDRDSDIQSIREERVRDATTQDLAGRVQAQLGAASPFPDDAAAAAWLRPLLVDWGNSARSPSVLGLHTAVQEKFGLPATALRGMDAVPPSPEQRALVDAIYANTQAHLAAAGITELTLARGARVRDTLLPAGFQTDADSRHGDQHVNAPAMLAPLSSWTGSASMAGQFTSFMAQAPRDATPRTAAQLTATVPAARIFSTGRTGLGELRGYEYVLVGGPADVRWHAKESGAGFVYRTASPTPSPAPIDEDPSSADWLRIAVARSQPATRAFNPDQPRVPAGQPGGGQWGSGSGVANEDQGPDWSPDAIPGRVLEPAEDAAFNAHMSALEAVVGTQPDKAATAAVGKWLTAYSRQAHNSHLGIDFTGMASENAMAIAAQTAVWLDRYPNLAGFLNSIEHLGARNFLATTDKGNGDSWASTRFGEILLNGKQLGAKAFAPVDRHELEVTSGWAAAGVDGLRGIIAHELGHVTENWMILHGQIGQLPAGVKAAHDALRATTPDAALSHYALTSNREAFAEAFSQRELAPKSAWDPYTHQLDTLLSMHGGLAQWGGLYAHSGRTRAFNPDQPRDDHGRWTSDGSAPAVAEGPRSAANRGRWSNETAASPTYDAAVQSLSNAIYAGLDEERPPGAPSVEEQWLKDRYREIAPRQADRFAADLSRIPDHLQIPFAAQLASLFTLHPEIVPELHRVEALSQAAMTKLGHGYAVGLATHTTGTLSFNASMMRRYFPDAPRTEASTWSPAGTDGIRGVVAHEFGHLVEYHLRDSHRTRAALAEYDTAHQHQGEFLSGYAIQANNHWERFADAFAQITLAPRAVWSPYTAGLVGAIGGHKSLLAWLTEAWDAAEHPRDEHGRFIGGTAQAHEDVAARTWYQRHNTAEVPSQREVNRLARSVSATLRKEVPRGPKALDLMNIWHSGVRSSKYRDVRSAVAQEFRITGDWATHRDPSQYRPLVQAIYRNTQAELAAAGLKEVTLYRGLLLGNDTLPPGVGPGHSAGHADTIHLGRPLASWTSNPEIPPRFAKSHHKDGMTAVILQATFPASRVFSTAHTGVGLLRKEEFVVLGGPQHVRLHTQDASGKWDLYKSLMNPTADDENDAWLHDDEWSLLYEAPDGEVRTVATPHELGRALAGMDMTLAEFLASPEAAAMPASLRAQVQRAVTRFNPDEPRVPAGSGDVSGEWTSTGAGGGVTLLELRKPEPTALQDTIAAAEPAMVAAASLNGQLVEDYKAAVEANLKRVYDEAEVHILLRADRVGKLLKDGELKTAFEVNRIRKQDEGYMATRSQIEQTMFGLPKDAPVDNRPVYGSLETPGVGPHVIEHDSYGGTTLELKPSVKDRATAQWGDSFERRQVSSDGKGWYAASPAPVRDPKWYTSGTYARIKDVGADADPARLDSASNMRGAAYIETQIHGDASHPAVAVSDIARVVFDKPPAAGTVKALDKLGIPHATYEFEAEPYPPRTGRPPAQEFQRVRDAYTYHGGELQNLSKFGENYEHWTGEPKWKAKSMAWRDDMRRWRGMTEASFARWGEPL